MEDLRDLCRELNQRGALYVVIGGFALRAADYVRSAMDVDLIVAADLETLASSKGTTKPQQINLRTVIP